MFDLGENVLFYSKDKNLFFGILKEGKVLLMYEKSQSR